MQLININFISLFMLLSVHLKYAKTTNSNASYSGSCWSLYDTMHMDQLRE